MRRRWRQPLSDLRCSRSLRTNQKAYMKTLNTQNTAANFSFWMSVAAALSAGYAQAASDIVAAPAVPAPVKDAAPTGHGPGDEDGFSATFGIGFGRTSLRGTSDKVKAFPIASLDWRSGPYFAGMSSGFGYHWIRSERLTMSTALTAAGGRREKDSERFKGLGDIKTSLAAMISAEWTPFDGPLAVQAGYQRAFGKNLGSGLHLGLGSGFPISEKVMVSVNVSGNYADKSRMQSQYGITTVQALNSGYQVFTPKAGLESIDFGLGLNYMLDKKWGLGAQVGMNRLQGEAAKSQIFKDKKTATGGLFASYKF
jgi:MipA family protein